ncbi:MAG: hypothetical protein IJW42_04715 [Alistipes sp.]|nr:hypothetical protein [Alistipes sp.]
MKRLLLFCIVACWSVCGMAATARPTQLSCENQPQPLIDVANPRFSWVNVCVARHEQTCLCRMWSA